MFHEPRHPEAELARLADGSLPADRELRLRARVEGSSELAAALSEQQRAVSLLAALNVPAPPALRARIHNQTAAATTSRRHRRPRRTLVLTAATALAATAVVVLAGGAPPPPTIPQTARLALAAATIPAPPRDSAHSDQLRLRDAGIPFPYWGKAGWETTGARIDTLDGRRIVTVFYKDAADVKVGYAIVSGPALHAVTGTSRTVRHVRFTLRRQGHAELVTWQRDGHTCVLAGPSMAYGKLLSLASGGGGSAAD